MLESLIFEKHVEIEAWFRQEWKKTPAPLTSSVDLRQAGFKLAPVDTNLFPAGFNNLSEDSLPLCVQAIQAILSESFSACQRVLIIPESHTRNPFYIQSLNVLKSLFEKAGCLVRIGTLLPEKIEIDGLEFEPIFRDGAKIYLPDFKPCFILLNNDLSDGLPEILQNLDQKIMPSEKLGWSHRLKSNHFKHYQEVAEAFSTFLGIDSWSINPDYQALDGIDFMAQEGLDKLYYATKEILEKTRLKYQSLKIDKAPFAVIKADNGTYGMSVMMVHEAEEVLHLNRKQRTKMAAIKGANKVNKVLVQEGVFTFETTDKGDVSEPVVYMLGSYVVGGFYRVHQDKGVDENLNSPGMHFIPLPFSSPCNMPKTRFYIYGVIARLAALAAAREMAELKEPK